MNDNIIPYNLNLFEDADCGSLQEFNDFLDQLPAQKLIAVLEKERGHGRNDWPVETMWRCFIAQKYFKHQGVTELRAELARNPYLRVACHVQPLYNRQHHQLKSLVPSPAAFTRFVQKLLIHQDLVDQIFANLRTDLREQLPDWGQILALDGKIIQSYANHPNKKNKLDGRRDKDADYTKKVYEYTSTKDGKNHKIVMTFFGFRVHLIVDAKYELPLMFTVTKASVSEKTMAEKLLAEMPEWLKNTCKYLTADRGYDSKKLQKAIEDQGIKPIIPLVNHWKDKEQTRQYRDTNFVYTYDGRVYYITKDNQVIPATFKGYHKASDSLRYEVKLPTGKEKLYLKRKEDPRVFNIVARDSKKFWRYYRKRTSVERVNGRLDRDYLFENHRLRGLKIMQLQVTIACIMMLGHKKQELKRQAGTQAA